MRLQNLRNQNVKSVNLLLGALGVRSQQPGHVLLAPRFRRFTDPSVEGGKLLMQ